MNETICLACGIFKNDLIKLKDRLNLRVLYIDSILHMNPEKLEKLINERIKQYQFHNILILFGDCHANMLDVEKNSRVARVDGINCCDIILGEKRYRELRRAKTFILMNEWVHRWEEVFKVELGFADSNSAKTFMHDMHSKFVYLYTDNEQIPYEVLEKISEYCGLPYETERYDISYLYKSMLKALKKLEVYG